MVDFRFRIDPVPHTGSNRGLRHYFKTHFRYPHTTNEKRSYFCCSNKNIIRSKRKPIRLPSSWEDIDRNRERNWKRQKRTRRQHGYNQEVLRGLTHYYDVEEISK